MRVPIFLSHPTPHREVQKEFVRRLCAALLARGIEPHTLGPSSGFDYAAPLVGIRKLMAHCCGLIAVAFRRTYAPSAIRYFDADLPDVAQEPLSCGWFTSPYCQIEPAMAFQLGLPILILREKGVLPEGVLEKGVTGFYMPEFETEGSEDYLEGQECRALLEQWAANARTVYDRRGQPPALYG